ncbi:hypothetical protein H103_00298 [Trichophyton rubrum CBS 288.86]|uniref:Uncharacterized protein n=1 Tax=Trichophyton rubrum CBS 288.86 TaxID=1215330 RepID=A0A022WGK1_TRIRU|nr:hypothetical protein H103_00298 [Trichophyton rubrum CBS 288.86]
MVFLFRSQAKRRKENKISNGKRACTMEVEKKAIANRVPYLNGRRGDQSPKLDGFRPHRCRLYEKECRNDRYPAPFQGIPELDRYFLPDQLSQSRTSSRQKQRTCRRKPDPSCWPQSQSSNCRVLRH